MALTDHNTIAGAQLLQRLAPDWLTVIIGEEVSSAQGEIVGLFLRQEIPSGLPISDTIQRIHVQGGLAILPHPFDRCRRRAVGKRHFLAVKNQIDFVEAFNSRTLFREDTRQAYRLAAQHNLPICVGSDAHLPGEYGNAVCLISPFSSPAQFARNLRAADFRRRRCTLLTHFVSCFPLPKNHHGQTRW